MVTNYEFDNNKDNCNDNDTYSCNIGDWDIVVDEDNFFCPVKKVL